MSLTTHDKLQLLKDLLINQEEERYMTGEEAAQIERLVSFLSSDPLLTPEIQQMMSHIQQTHEQTNTPFQQADVEMWLNTIQNNQLDNKPLYSPGNSYI